MENASKALLIAAAILIAIILITLGIKVLGSADDTAKQAQDVGDSISSATKDSTSKLESLLSGLGGGSSSLKHDVIIPEGGKCTIKIQLNTYPYTKYITYVSGDKMPELPDGSHGHTYSYSDYNYSYNINGYWTVNEVSDKGKESYNKILISIAGKPVTAMQSTFQGCTLLKESPAIPESITSMQNVFKGCTSLTEVPKLPDNLRVLHYTFEGCTSLEKAPTIPGKVWNAPGVFKNCTILEGTITIDATPNSGLSNYKEFFFGTEKEIVIKGKCSNSMKRKIAETATKGNVTWK